MGRTRAAGLLSSLALGGSVPGRCRPRRGDCPRGFIALAEPSGSSDPGEFGNIEVWLDTPFPADAAAGRRSPVGLTVWASAAGDLVRDERPVSSGSTRPPARPARPRPRRAPTGPGHLLAQVTFPVGGAGRGCRRVPRRARATRATLHATSTCPLRSAGTGPPPDAPRAVSSSEARAPAADPRRSSPASAFDLSGRPGASGGLGSGRARPAGSRSSCTRGSLGQRPGPRVGRDPPRRRARRRIPRAPITIPRRPGDVALDVRAARWPRAARTRSIESATTRVTVVPATEPPRPRRSRTRPRTSPVAAARRAGARWPSSRAS